MIERFQVGKWYRYVGEKIGPFSELWADFIVDGNPHQCTFVSPICVGFADGDKKDIWTWTRATMKKFDEVFMPKEGDKMINKYKYDEVSILKKGEPIMVRNNDAQPWVKRIFLYYDNSLKHVPYICVWGNDEKKFVNGKEYRPEHWCQAKPFEKPEVKPELKRMRCCAFHRC